MKGFWACRIPEVPRPPKMRKSAARRRMKVLAGLKDSTPKKNRPRRFSMRQIVDEVVHRYAVGHVGPFGRIHGLVGPFPCVSKVHVVTYGDHHAPLVVVDALPLRSIPVLLISSPATEILRARNLVFVIEIVKGVKDRVGFWQI